MGRGGGGLTSAEDRRKALEFIDAAVASGARARVVGALLGLGLPTLHRWRWQFAGDGDCTYRYKGSHRVVSHRLSEELRERILLTPETIGDSWHCVPDKSC